MGLLQSRQLTVLNHLLIFVFQCNVFVGLDPLNPGCSIQPSSGKQESSPKTALVLKHTLTIISAQISSNNSVSRF